MFDSFIRAFPTVPVNYQLRQPLVSANRLIAPQLSIGMQMTPWTRVALTWLYEARCFRCQHLDTESPGAGRESSRSASSRTLQLPRSAMVAPAAAYALGYGLARLSSHGFLPQCQDTCTCFSSSFHFQFHFHLFVSAPPRLALILPTL